MDLCLPQPLRAWGGITQRPVRQSLRAMRRHCDTWKSVSWGGGGVREGGAAAELRTQRLRELRLQSIRETEVEGEPWGVPHRSRCRANLEQIQGYIAHKKPPPPRTLE